LNSSKINPAGEPKAGGGHKPCAGKKEVLQETFLAQGFGQVVLPRPLAPPPVQFMLFNRLLYHNKHRCPVGERGIRKKAGGCYATKVNADALIPGRQFSV
jgi:hypothetical protein